MPILFIFLALIPGAGAAEGHTQTLALKLVAQEIGIGLMVGLGLTFLAAQVIKRTDRQEWITETWRQLPVLALAFTCYAVAQLLGGSGFIAAAGPECPRGVR